MTVVEIVMIVATSLIVLIFAVFGYLLQRKPSPPKPPKRIRKLVKQNYRLARSHRKGSSMYMEMGEYQWSRNELTYALNLEQEAEELLERWGEK